MIYTRPKQKTKEGHDDDKVEEIEFTALSSASDSRIGSMPDSITGSHDKPTIELLQQMPGEIPAVRCK